MQDSRTPRDNSVQSVDRAISILQVLARHGTASVTEIAAPRAEFTVRASDYAFDSNGCGGWMRASG